MNPAPLVARIEISWDSLERLKKILTTDDFEPSISRQYLRKVLGLNPDMTVALETYTIPRDTVITIDPDGLYLTEIGVSFEVKKFHGTMPLTAVLPEGRGDVAVYVQVPHVGLLSIDEVIVVTDYCTEQLQEDLNAGWRILCVCPPNAARRPDYVLGRTKALVNR